MVNIPTKPKQKGPESKYELEITSARKINASFP
jgi:hypothetical protein